MQLHERGALSIREAAKHLSIGRTSLYGLINRGELVTIKVGRRRLITADSVKAWLESNAMRKGDQS